MLLPLPSIWQSLSASSGANAHAKLPLSFLYFWGSSHTTTTQRICPHFRKRHGEGSRGPVAPHAGESALCCRSADNRQTISGFPAACAGIASRGRRSTRPESAARTRRTGPAALQEWKDRHRQAVAGLHRLAAHLAVASILGQENRLPITRQLQEQRTPGSN